MTEYLTPKQFARMRGLPLPTVYRHVREGWLPVTRVGRSIRINREDAAAYVLPVGVVPHHRWGLPESLCPREEMLWGAVAAAYVGAHGGRAARPVHRAWQGR